MELLSLAIALLLAAVLLLANFLAAKLPTEVKTIDLTSNKMYSVTDSTKREVAKSTMPIRIYLVSVNGEKALSEEGIHLHTFLGNLASVNGKISYSVVDPLKETDFLAAYSFSSEIGNLSVVVESALRSYHIPYSEFFGYYIDQVGKISETDAIYYYYYYGVTPSYCFDGESMLLTAIRYVSSTDLPTVYTLSGHTEDDVLTNAATMFKSLNISPVALSLASGASVPTDCDLLIINAPQTDISSAEAILLCDYLARGGAILLSTTPEISAMPNLGVVTAYMSLMGEDGIVTDSDAQYYYSSSYPYYLLPSVNSHPATAGVTSVLLPVAHSITTTGSTSSSVTVTPLLTTSKNAYILPLDAASLDKPADAEVTSFCVGVVSENTATGAKLVWIPSFNFFSDSVNELSSGGNSALLDATVTWICGETEKASSASPLPLVTEMLNVSTGKAGFLSFFITLLLPGAIVGFGLFRIFKRKRR